MAAALPCALPCCIVADLVLDRPSGVVRYHDSLVINNTAAGATTSALLIRNSWDTGKFG